MGADRLLSAFGRAAAELEVEADDGGTIPTTDFGVCSTAAFEPTIEDTVPETGCLSNDDISAAGEAFFFASSSSARLRFHASRRSLRCRIFSSSFIAAGGGVTYLSLAAVNKLPTEYHVDKEFWLSLLLLVNPPCDHLPGPVDHPDLFPYPYPRV